MKTLTILLGEHPCIVNILLGPMTVHYREVLLYSYITILGDFGDFQRYLGFVDFFATPL